MSDGPSNAPPVLLPSDAVLLRGMGLIGAAPAAAGPRRTARRFLLLALVATAVAVVLLRVFGSPSFDDLLARVRPWPLCGPVAHLEGHDSVARSAAVREALAEAVLMDLSDLGPEDLGCAYELGLLLDRVPLSRVLLLVEASTNLDCLEHVLDAAEQRIAADSPNRGADASAWRLLRIGGSSRRGPDESHHDWLRRLDRRLDPLALVHFLWSRDVGERQGTASAGLLAAGSAAGCWR